MNAPKGLGMYKGKLYAADISEVVVIDMKKGKIEKRIAIDSAKGLNDITVDKKGIVYVSDSRTSKIWRIKKGVPTLYLDNMKGVNGLKSIGDDLYILSGKSFVKADKNKQITAIVELPQGGDGIEPIGNGDFIITAWAGYIFYVTASGTVETMLDSHLEKINTADIGYDPVKKIVFVPTFNAKKIVAYSLVVSADKPQVYIMDPDRLQEIRNKVHQKDVETLELVDNLKKSADALLNMKPFSVMDKEFTPVSGNKHDYMSQAPYFWYDSTKPNGLPYMRKDGVRNPEINKITDHKFLADLDNASRILSLAWYFTGEEKYAEKATDLLRNWFFNEATRMNPNLEYAQAIPGINNGRGIGIIESRSLTGIADAAGLLNGSNAWTESDNKSLQQWYSQYLQWMLTSKNGNDEHAAKNNHGTWFYVQSIDFALFTDDRAKARELAEESKKIIDNQITKEGRMPLELERTNALGYSTFNLRALFDLATLAEKTAVDLWHYQNPQGATIRTAFDWLKSYALAEKPWTYQQINKYNRNEFYPLLLQAAAKFKEPVYMTQANVMSRDVSDLMIPLLYKN
jgi:hypothetical protein